MKYLCFYFILFFSFPLVAEEVVVYSSTTNAALYNPIAITPDNKNALASFGTNGLYQVNLETGTVKTIYDDTVTIFDTQESSHSLKICHIEISSSKKYLGIVSARTSYMDNTSIEAYCIVFRLDDMEIVFKQTVSNLYYLHMKPDLFINESDVIFFDSSAQDIYTAGSDYIPRICLYDLNQRKYLANFLYDNKTNPHNLAGRLQDVAVNPTLSNIILSFTPTGVTEVYDFTGKKVTELPITGATNYTFTPDGKFLVSTSMIYDGRTYREIKQREVYSVELSSNKEFFMDGLTFHSLDPNSFDQELFSFDPSHLSSSGVLNISHTPDLDIFIIGDATGSLSIYKSKYKKSEIPKTTASRYGIIIPLDCIYTTSLYQDEEWVSITPDGYYNASPEGDDYINIRYGLNAFGLSQFSKSYNQPNVIYSRYLGLQDPEIVEYFGDLRLSAAPPVITIKERRQSGKTLIDVTVIDAMKKYPLESVQIFINGRMLGLSELNELTGKQLYAKNTKIISREEFPSVMNFTIPLELEEGNNLVEVIAANEACYGINSIEIKSDKQKNKNKPDLWIYAIGINEYDYLPKTRPNNDTGLVDLVNAVADSEKIVKTFLKQQGKKYNKVHVLKINDTTKLKPTKNNLISNMSFFQDMKPHDVAIFFVAAHGVSINNKFHILTKDTKVDKAGLTPDLNNSITTDDILSFVNHPGRKFILIDTCHSGSVENNIAVRTLKNRSTVIFAAAEEDEFAQESEEIGGHFTHSITTFLNKNTSVLVTDLATFVEDEVKYLSRFGGRGRIRQHPEILIPDGFLNFLMTE